MSTLRSSDRRQAFQFGFLGIFECWLLRQRRLPAALGERQVSAHAYDELSHFRRFGVAGLPGCLHRFVHADAQSRGAAPAVCSVLLRVRHCWRLDRGVGTFSIGLGSHESDIPRDVRATRACCFVHLSRAATRALHLSSSCTLDRFRLSGAVGSLVSGHCEMEMKWGQR